MKVKKSVGALKETLCGASVRIGQDHMLWGEKERKKGVNAGESTSSKKRVTSICRAISI